MKAIKKGDYPLGDLLDSSPCEDGRLKRSFLNYHQGIPDFDELLNGRRLTDLDLEFGICVYKHIVTFFGYHGDTINGKFPIARKSIIRIDSFHDQKLNIRKDSKVDGGILGAVGYLGAVGAIVAGTIDAITTGNKEVPKDQIVIGSLFEIVVKADDETEEKIILSCSNKHREPVEKFLNNIINPVTQEKKKACYIATVCYGDIDAPQVVRFREYRDEKLNKTAIGRLFIWFYYLVSPSISRFLHNKVRANHLVKTYVLDKIYQRLK